MNHTLSSETILATPHVFGFDTVVAGESENDVDTNKWKKLEFGNLLNYFNYSNK